MPQRERKGSDKNCLGQPVRESYSALRDGRSRINRVYVLSANADSRCKARYAERSAIVSSLVASTSGGLRLPAAVFKGAPAMTDPPLRARNNYPSRIFLAVYIK